MTARSTRDPADPRSARTRARIREVILGAARAGDGLDALSVAELCRRAEVHRVTFYGHFRSLDEAIAEALTTLVDDLSTIGEEQVSAAGSVEALSSIYRDALGLQVEQLATHREVYQRLFRADAAHSFTTALTASLPARAQLAIDAFVDARIEVPGARDGIAAASLGAGITAAFGVVVAAEETDLEDIARRITAQLPRWWPAG